MAKLRFGLVLTAAGGVLGKMLPPFRSAWGKAGDGKQYMSWISMADLIAIVHHVIGAQELSGPINATSPNPVTNEEFTHTLGRVLERPTPFPVPAMVLRAMFGQMADGGCCWAVHASCRRNWNKSGLAFDSPAGAGIAGRASGLRHGAPVMTKPRAIVLLSGGLDSATALAMAMAEGYDVVALSFHYGQRHAVELKRRARRTCLGCGTASGS